jgi:hypothetical protein
MDEKLETQVPADRVTHKGRVMISVDDALVRHAETFRKLAEDARRDLENQVLGDHLDMVLILADAPPPRDR